MMFVGGSPLRISAISAMHVTVVLQEYRAALQTEHIAGGFDGAQPEVVNVRAGDQFISKRQYLTQAEDQRVLMFFCFSMRGDVTQIADDLDPFARIFKRNENHVGDEPAAACAAGDRLKMLDCPRGGNVTECCLNHGAVHKERGEAALRIDLDPEGQAKCPIRLLNAAVRTQQQDRFKTVVEDRFGMFFCPQQFDCTLDDPFFQFLGMVASIFIIMGVANGKCCLIC